MGAVAAMCGVAGMCRIFEGSWGTVWEVVRAQEVENECGELLMLVVDGRSCTAIWDSCRPERRD